MKTKNKTMNWVLPLLLTATAAQADNPLVPINMADPHVHIFNNKAYMFTTRDVLPIRGWHMPDWQVWSSDDLVNWKKELVIKPTDTYIGESELCFASDAATRKGKYYFYFSNYTKDSGVMVADKPEGPYVDALGKPLLPEDLTSTKEYDISVPVDDDGFGYIIFGVNNKNLRYHIAKLNPDMISLAEKPKPITITGEFRGSDKPNVHIHGGKYYLSVGANYAIADNIYGPYTTKRSCVDENHPYGWNQRAHGNFFDWKNQSFYAWCRFERGNPDIKRDSFMTYVHYRKNGDMVYDEELLAKHYKTGVGQYDAAWDKIEAEWFMGMADGAKKTETALDSVNFVISNLQNGNYLRYPQIHNCPAAPVVELNYACATAKGGSVSVRQGTETGAEIGRANFVPTGAWTNYQTVSIPLKAGTAGETRSLAFVFEGTAGQDLIHVDAFKIKPGK